MSIAVAVPEHVLVKRINRRLAPNGEKMKVARTRYRSTVGGKYYIFAIDGNFVVRDHINLETIARELGALAPGERLAGESQEQT